jgi:hypothetical protein
MRRMGLLVVLLFTVPVLVGLAVVAVKAIEFTVSRDIASTKGIARRTMLLVLGATAIGFAAWFVYVAMGMPSMRVMGMLVLWFAGTALVGAVIQRTEGFSVAVGAGWVDIWRSRQGSDYDAVEIVEPFTIELRAATYANVLYPSDGVPLYL